MKQGLLNIAICPENDMFEKLEVIQSYCDDYYEVAIHTTIDESFSSLISSDELNAICKMRSINPRREFFNSELNLVLSNYLSKENHKVFEKK